MSDWMFVDIPENAAKGLERPDFPFPIRRERVALFEEFKQEAFPVVFVAGELDRYLEEQPARVERYRKQGSQLFFCAGFDCWVDHCFEDSAHYYKVGLWLDPTNLLAHLRLGGILAHLGKPAEAVEQYRAVIAQGHIYYRWHAWMLCARALMSLGQYREALMLLEEAEQVVPDDDLFWVTLAACKERLHPQCPQCGHELHGDERFCGGCGARVAIAAAI